MNPEVKNKWLTALRSGEYTQGTCALQSTDGAVMRHCCLGVLCDLAVKSGVTLEVMHAWDGTVRYDGEGGVLPFAVRQWAGLEDANPHALFRGGSIPEKRSLAELNDSGHSFGEIADLIEDQF